MDIFLYSNNKKKELLFDPKQNVTDVFIKISFNLIKFPPLFCSNLEAGIISNIFNEVNIYVGLIPLIC